MPKSCRSEFAVLLARAFSLSDNLTMSFSDVKTGDWYAGAVGAATKAGLVDGLEGGFFQPNSPITLEQMAVMISSAMKVAGKTAE